MESSLKNMILALLFITMASALSVAGIYMLTEDTIAEAKDAKTAEAIGAVVPEYDNNPARDSRSEEVDGGEIRIYTAKNGGQAVGYAIETFSNNGYSGTIRLLVGFLPDGTINDIAVLEQYETPGLGSKMAEPDNKLIVQFQGSNPSELKMKVTKDGGDIDALTASTISSRAYVEAVQRAYDAFLKIGK